MVNGAACCRGEAVMAVGNGLGKRGGQRGADDISIMAFLDPPPGGERGNTNHNPDL